MESAEFKIPRRSALAPATVVAVAVALCSGCSKPATSAGEGASDPAEDRLADKLDGYIGCINDAYLPAMKSRDYYLHWLADPDVGPTGTETHIQLYRLDAAQKCAAATAAAAAMAPSLPDLDRAAQALSTAVTRLEPIVNQTHAYYDQKDYKDDQFARGKSLHGPLVAGFAEVAATGAALQREVEKIDDDLKQQQLARMEKEHGRDLAFLHANAMQLAKALLGAGLEQSPSVDVLQARLDPFLAAVQELSDLATKRPEQFERVAAYSVVTSDLADLSKAGKERLRRVRDKVAYTKADEERFAGPFGYQVEGSPQHLLRAYNDLVQHSNGLFWK